MSVKPVPAGGDDTPEPSLEVVKLAWLEMAPVPHVVRSVVPETWTLKVLFGPGEAARSMGPQVRVWWPAALPSGEQAALHAFPTRRSSELGKESLMVKPWAMPGPLL